MTKPQFEGGLRRRQEPSTVKDLRKRARPGSKQDELPLVHVTAAFVANEIVQSGSLRASWCKVFEKDLVYFFGLRPDFRCRFGSDKSDQLTRFPVAFIIDASAVPAPYHVYPFDTGAAAHGFFNASADPYVPLEDYELDPDHQSVRGLIEWAFGTPDAYFESDLRREAALSIKGFESASKGYIDIARMGRERVDANTAVDTRATAIEVTADHNVALKGVLKLAILPKQYLQENEELIDSLKALGAATEFYDWRSMSTPDSYRPDLARIAKEWLSKNGHI